MQRLPASVIRPKSARVAKVTNVPALSETTITEIQNLLSNSKVRNVIHSGRITFRVLTNYIPLVSLSLGLAPAGPPSHGRRVGRPRRSARPVSGGKAGHGVGRARERGM